MNPDIMFGKITNMPSKNAYTVVQKDKKFLVSFSGKSADLAAKYLAVGKVISIQGNEFLILSQPKTGKEKWMLDFLSTKEVVTNEEEKLDFLDAYGRSVHREVLPEIIYVFAGGYFVAKQNEKFIIDYDGDRHEFLTLEMAELCLADIEVDDSPTDEMYIHLDPETTLIGSIETEFIGDESYRDKIILKNGITISITEDSIRVFQRIDETDQFGEIFYHL